MDESQKDHFPPTLHTWIGEKIGLGVEGRDDINQYIMEAYEPPLRIYLRSTSWGNWQDLDEIINGFLADRLDREDFFAKWQASGKRLRHWLINALHFYLKEEWRRERRHDAARLGDGGEEDPGAIVQDPVNLEQEINCVWAKSVIAAACKDAEASCQADGLDSHWALFIRHYLDGRSYRDCAVEFNVDPKRCAVMARTATQRFRQALHQRLQDDGVPAEDLDHEIMLLQESLG
ncbi:MAG: hypothetical protein MK100_01120 [Phycisphaerales bacterium]|nr:hypothetical protein [Phycisphaerales bacterium]